MEMEEDVKSLTIKGVYQLQVGLMSILKTFQRGYIGRGRVIPLISTLLCGSCKAGGFYACRAILHSIFLFLCCHDDIVFHRMKIRKLILQHFSLFTNHMT